ncbi:AAA family ATPase [Microbacterium sp. SD291]|uniref:ATP-binding protein n=1 Tax=Microbacterium sp. SD291 TaxID=2782007 RepID=UPI001A96932F|nr:LuxR family transcriptional regulator [Microbacterium sp. SD291]MBO0981227.1 AAA family ATPase [Microbacterium sp. SD291]
MVPTAHALPTSAHRVVIGRDAEIELLRAGLRTGTATTGRFISVHGELGIGKTSIIEEALRHAPAGRAVLRGAADAMNQRRPYGLLLDAFASRLTDDERRSASALNEVALGERLLALIDALSVDPAVIVLEDLQWADTASLTLLARLCRTLAQIPLLIIASQRTQASHEISPELDHLLGTLDERGLLISVALGPLALADCTLLAERLTGGRPATTLERYLAAAGGNPLFLTEMIRALQSDGAVTIDQRGDVLLDAPVGPSPSLAMVMMRHLSHLSPATRELLTTAALLGSRFDAAQLRVAAGRPMGALLPSLREAFAAGFLEGGDQGELGFRHGLIQEVLLQDLPPAVHAELHREVAVRLHEASAPAAVVAVHLLQAPTSPADLAWMQRLAAASAIASPAIAVELWERIVAASTAEDPLNVRATAGLARAALSAGRAAEAGELAARALRHAVPSDTIAALSATATHALMLQRHHVEAKDASARYAEIEILEPVDRAAHLAFAGWPLLMLGDLAGAQHLAVEGAAMAAAVGNPAAEVLALTLHGQISDCRGDLDEAIALLSKAAERADQHPSLASTEVFPHVQLALALTDADRTQDVDVLLHRGLSLSDELGYRMGSLAAHAFGAQVRSRTGILSDLVAELDAHASLVGSMDVRMSPPVTGMRAQVAAHQHGAEAALVWAALLEPVPDRGFWAGRGRSWIWRGLSRRHRPEHDDLGALETLWTGWQELRGSEMLMDCAELGLDLVVVGRRVAADRPARHAATMDRLREVVEVVGALADRNPDVASLRATALAVQGVADARPDDLVEAARLMAGTGRRLEQARIAELAALAPHGRADEARRLAESALRLYAEVGADHDVIRARASFSRAGMPVRVVARTRATFGWDALTRTEERIALHVADGQSNPEIAQSLFVSRRTVESHVSHVLAKLALRSRTELAVFVARRLEDPRQHGQQIDPSAERR